MYKTPLALGLLLPGLLTMAADRDAPSSGEKRAAATPILKQFEETAYHLKDVVLVNEQTGWAVGAPHWDQAELRYKGTIIRTGDGGQTWTAQEVGTDVLLTAVSFVDANRGWVVGDDGTILHTSDGGTHWVRQPIGTAENFRGVVFVDAANGWATSIRAVHYWEFIRDFDDWQGSIWHTTNGGQSWVRQQVPAAASILNRIDFVDSSNGWAVGIKLTGYDGFGPTHTGAIYHTGDGGATWTEQYTTELGVTFTTVDFVDTMNGWAAGFPHSSTYGRGTVYHTSDGGQTWERQQDVGGFFDPVRDLQFVDRSRGYAVGTAYIGDGAAVWRTLDGGVTWTNIRMRKDNPLGVQGLYGVAVAGDRVIGIGDRDYLATSTHAWGSCGTMQSCGTQCECLFEQSYLNPHYIFHDVFFADDTHGWVVGSRTFDVNLWEQIILGTQDGGLTWATQYEHAPLPDRLFDIHRLESVFFADGQNGWAVGTSTRKEENGEHGPVSKRRSAILHTADGGLHWQEQGQEICADKGCEFSSVQFTDNQNGWALSTKGFGSQNILLAHTIDGGAHWNWVDTGVEGVVAVGFAFVQGALTFTDAQHGWVAGWNTMIGTTDGGAHWTKQAIACGSSLCFPAGAGMAFTGGQKGWIAGDGLYRTIDSGAHWTKAGLTTSGRLKDIHFVDAQTGWLVGERGSLLTTGDAGETWQPVGTGAWASLLGVHFANARRGWVVGDQGTILSYASDRNPSGLPAVFSVSNGASFLPGIASGAWISIFGENLSNTTRLWSGNDFNGAQLPVALDGVSVKINGQPAFPSYISPTQLNVLVDADSAAGPVSVEVTAPAGQSEPLATQKSGYSPALFAFSIKGGRYIIAHLPDGTWVGDYVLARDLGLTGNMRVAKPGEIITVYGTGFGPTNPALPPSRLVEQPARLATPVDFRIGRKVAEVRWAGMIGPGLCQFNVVIPEVPSGGHVIVAEIDGYQSQSGGVVVVGR